MDTKKVTTVTLTGGTGVLFVYGAISGKPILSLLRAILHGQNPQDVKPTQQITSSGAVGGVGPTAAAGSIVGIAESYEGKLTYVFGGPPPPDTVDCSSFANKVLAEAGVSDPGGQPFNPNVHGPNTLSYLTWGGAVTVGHTSAVAQPGDLVVWQTHMGIAVGNGRMVSALNPTDGVKQTPIDGMIPEFLFVRRLTNTPALGAQPGKSYVGA